MRMRKFFSLMATVLMAVGVQAQTAETALFSETGTYSNGYTWYWAMTIVQKTIPSSSLLPKLIALISLDKM